MFLIGIPLYGTMTLLPTMMQSLMNYPVITAGFVPRRAASARCSG